MNWVAWTLGPGQAWSNCAFALRSSPLTQSCRQRSKGPGACFAPPWFEWAASVTKWAPSSEREEEEDGRNWPRFRSCHVPRFAVPACPPVLSEMWHGRIPKRVSCSSKAARIKHLIQLDVQSSLKESTWGDGHPFVLMVNGEVEAV